MGGINVFIIQISINLFHKFSINYITNCFIPIIELKYKVAIINLCLCDRMFKNA